MDLWPLFAITEPTVLMPVSLIWRYLLPNHISESSAKASEALIESVHAVGSLSLEAREKLRRDRCAASPFGSPETDNFILCF